MGVNKKQAQLFGSIRAADILISPFVAGWLIQPAIFLSLSKEKNTEMIIQIFHFSIMEI
jgi:hypothetical protein